MMPGRRLGRTPAQAREAAASSVLMAPVPAPSPGLHAVALTSQPDLEERAEDPAAGQNRRIRASSGGGLVAPRDEEHFHPSHLDRPALSLLNGRPPLTEHPRADVARRLT